MKHVENIKSIINDTLYEPKSVDKEEPKFKGNENFFDLKAQQFNKTCSIMTVQTKILNISKINSIEFWGLYLQVSEMVSS